MTERKGFTSRLGFILAAAAAAIGIGALWRFPPLVVEYGGGTFLLLYLLMTFTLGLVLLITEIAIGRKTGQSALLSFSSLNKKWGFLGILSIVVAGLILPYYSVIGGWVMNYGALYITGNENLTLNLDFFQTFISDPVIPVIWTIIFLAITAGILLFGVTKGIQRFSTIILPFLIVVMIGISIYCISLPGGLDGLAHYFIPDFSKLSVSAVLEALGMTFFSLCVASGAMVTYGSYLSKKENIEKSAFSMVLFSAGVTILAGLLIVPAFFSFSGGDTSIIQSGTSLLFIQMPQVFGTMPFGAAIGAVFFICVFFAALTSSIALFEVLTSALIDRFKLSRIKAVGIVFGGALILALVVNFGYSIWSFISIGRLHILEIMDSLSGNILMPIVALLTIIFVGWIIKGNTSAISEEVESSGRFASKKFYHVMIRYIAPVCLAVILCFMTIKTLLSI